MLIFDSLIFQAFIHFPDWMSCLIFFEQHNNKRLTLCGSALTPHFVMEPMVTEYTEVKLSVIFVTFFVWFEENKIIMEKVLGLKILSLKSHYEF